MGRRFAWLVSVLVLASSPAAAQTIHVRAWGRPVVRRGAGDCHR